jgi:serine/threonine-protein kinase
MLRPASRNAQDTMPEPTKYRLVQPLGAGGMGTIHKGMLIGQAGFQRPIVIKQLRHADDPQHVELFVQEARRYAPLDHENIGRIFDFERVDGELCIILEYIDGWSLIEYIDRHKELGRLPDVELTVFIISRLCRALQYVFERAAIVHRDISPSNVMMTREGAVKLIDFGIATRAGTRDNSLTGKPAYMAPEMVVELRADNRSDLFSLGTVFFEMLTTERLFDGKGTTAVLAQVIAARYRSPRTYNPDVPDAVLEILERALKRKAEERFATAGEMGEACEHFLYDKGYGPTNLTLKQHLHELFPPPASASEAESLEPFLIPIEEAATTPPFSLTPVGQARRMATQDLTPVSPDGPTTPPLGSGAARRPVATAGAGPHQAGSQPGQPDPRPSPARAAQRLRTSSPRDATTRRSRGHQTKRRRRG